MIDFGSIFGPPDPHDSMVSTMYDVLSHFLGKASKMVPKKVPKWTQHPPEASQNQPKPEKTTNAYRHIFLPVSFCPCRRHFRSFLFFFGFLGGPLGPPGNYEAILGSRMDPKIIKQMSKIHLRAPRAPQEGPGGVLRGSWGIKTTFFYKKRGVKRSPF